MEKQTIKKVQTMSYLAAGIITWLAVGVIFRALAGAFGVIQKFYGMDVFSHGLPVTAGILVFAVLQFNPKINAWAEDVILEVSKVVFPPRKDVVAMTIVVIIMVLIASGILFVFDNVARLLVGLVI